MTFDMTSKLKFEIAALSKENKVEAAEPNEDDSSNQTVRNSVSKMS
jgi:hypothetical protein